MKRLLLYLLIGLLTLASCSFTPGLDRTETQLYSNKAGYHITLPADWQLVAEEEQSAVFTAPHAAISLTIISELGGEAYYGLDEIAQMVLEQLPGTIIPWQISRTIIDTEQKLRLSVQGEDEEGAEIGLDITIFQPYPGMRYYLLFAAGRTAISRQDALIGDIVKNFGFKEDLPYLYALLAEWRSKESEQEARVDEDTNAVLETETAIKQEQEQTDYVY